MLLTLEISIFPILLFLVNWSMVLSSLPSFANDEEKSKNIWNKFIKENILPNPKLNNCLVNYCSKGSPDNIQILKVLQGGNFR
jgi:hypothetical protein